MKDTMVENLSISLIVPIVLAAFFSSTYPKIMDRNIPWGAPVHTDAINNELAAWKIQKGDEINFSMKGAEGTFSGLKGEILFDENKLSASKFDVSVDVATIVTGNDTKDKHARGEKWLDAVGFPSISFVSSSIKLNGNGYEVTGILDLRGVEKEISFPFTFTKNGMDGLFEGSLKIKREDFGIEGPFMAFMVGDEVQVDLKIPVRK